MCSLLPILSLVKDLCFLCTFFIAVSVYFTFLRLLVVQGMAAVRESVHFVTLRNGFSYFSAHFLVLVLVSSCLPHGASDDRLLWVSSGPARR